MTETRCSIIIPSYNRGQVLIDTLAALLNIIDECDEIIVIDQTVQHQEETERQLTEWSDCGILKWIKQKEPSIPKAMNRGATEAQGELLLFLDDDIIPDVELVEAHLRAQHESLGTIIAGRVLQPWHSDEHSTDPFTRPDGEFKEEFMGGNFSIGRDALMNIGGFDENFKKAAYRFERDFADRVLQKGGTIWYQPNALIRHLYHGSGGTRAHGNHLRSWNPSHPVGAYYYLLISPRVKHRWRQILGRFFGAIRTRHHLRKPWYIPVTLVSESLGFGWAVWLRLQGPRLISAHSS